MYLLSHFICGFRVVLRVLFIVLFLFFSLFPCDLTTIFSVMYGFLSFCICISSTDFWFDSPRSADEPDPSVFQIVASALDLGTYKALCTYFKVEYLFLVNFWLSQSKPNESSKPNVLGAHLTDAGPPHWGAPCGTWAHTPWERTSETVIIFLHVGSYPGLWLLTIPYPSPSYQSHCDSFFISLAVEDVFC